MVTIWLMHPPPWHRKFDLILLQSSAFLPRQRKLPLWAPPLFAALPPFSHFPACILPWTWAPKEQEPHCFIDISPAPVLNKLEASVQGSVTFHSRNRSEKFGAYNFQLKSLLNRTGEISTEKTNPTSFIFFFPFLFFSSTQTILSDLLTDLNLKMPFAREEYILQVVDLPAPWDSAYWGHQTEASEDKHPHFKSVRNAESRSCSLRILHK